MLAVKVICPHCQKRLKMMKPPAADHRILCPRCGHSFPFSPDAIGTTPATAPPPSVKPHAPASPPLSGKRHRRGIGLILVGFLLLLTATTGLVLSFVLLKGSRNSSTSAPFADETAREDLQLLPDPALTRTSTPAKAEQPWLSPKEQQRVASAITRGVEWFQKHQMPSGSWEHGQHEVGLAAFPALTLLECGVKPDDVRIQKAVQFVRNAIPRLNQTYELALAILLLDRLGDPADNKWIQTCALRLVAGQTATGGWTYGCPVLSPQQENDLLTVMRARRPRRSLGPGGSPPSEAVSNDPGAAVEAESDPAVDSKLLPEGGAAPLEKDRPTAAETKIALDHLPAELRKLASLQPSKKSHKLPPDNDGTDNSNTQFAILGLLAAGQHDLPLERADALIVRRFHASQVADGRWNYNYSSPAMPADLRPAMTGAGLLGLAVQYNVAHNPARAKDPAKQFKDPAVDKGFKYLAGFIDKAHDSKKKRNLKEERIDLYFLWTVERCGVLYNRRKIVGKDWYPWGVELLLAHQQGDGSWTNGGYYGSKPVIDTCFALLFLKRANLAKELTKKVRFFTEGKELHDSP